MSFKKASIVIPLRNEGPFIKDLVESLNKQKINDISYEFIFIDGASNDDTLETLKSCLKQFKFPFKVLSNPNKTTPKSLNIGIHNSSGEFIIRIDGHSKYPNDYIYRLLKIHSKYKCDNVGGIIKTIPINSSLKAYAISLAMSSIFCVGPSKFRISEESANLNIVEADTVPFGCFRKSIFEEIGLFNEKLLRNQDDEFNSRILAQGGRILLDKSIIIKYFGRDNFKKVFLMFFQYGFYKPLAVFSLKKIYTLRQLIPLFLFICLTILFFLSLIIPLAKILFISLVLIYGILSTLFSFYYFSKDKKLINFKTIIYSYYFLLASLSIHSGYAIGYLYGIIDLFLKRKKAKDILVTR